MSVKINYPKNTKNNISHNLVLFSDGKFKINNLKKYLKDSEFSYITDLLKTSYLEKNLLVFEITSKKKIVLISIKNNLKTSDIENLGAEFYGRINYGKNSEYFIISDSIESKDKSFLGHFLHGLKLKSYEFKKYKSKKDQRIISVNIIGNKNKPSIQNQIKFKLLRKDFYARDLVSEPGNVLHQMNMLKE